MFKIVLILPRLGFNRNCADRWNDLAHADVETGINSAESINGLWYLRRTKIQPL